jgi:hypothetical protein
VFCGDGQSSHWESPCSVTDLDDVQSGTHRIQMSVANDSAMINNLPRSCMVLVQQWNANPFLYHGRHGLSDLVIFFF